MSNGQARTTGTRHQPARAPTRPRSRERKSGATAAQPYAIRTARKSQPTLLIDRDLAPSTTVSGATIVTDSGPDHKRSPHHRRGLYPSGVDPGPAPGGVAWRATTPA